jgi:hypothetical protein
MSKATKKTHKQAETEKATKSGVFQMRVNEQFAKAVSDAADGLWENGAEKGSEAAAVVIREALKACSTREILKRKVVDLVWASNCLKVPVSADDLVKHVAEFASGERRIEDAQQAVHDAIGDWDIMPNRCFSVGPSFGTSNTNLDEADELPHVPSGECDARLEAFTHEKLAAEKLVLVSPNFERKYYGIRKAGNQDFDFVVLDYGDGPIYRDIAMQLGVWREFVKAEKALAEGQDQKKADHLRVVK